MNNFVKKYWYMFAGYAINIVLAIFVMVQVYDIDNVANGFDLLSGFPLVSAGWIAMWLNEKRKWHGNT